MDSEYNKEIQKYAKKDVVIALCAVAFFVILPAINMTVFPFFHIILPFNWEALPNNANLILGWPLNKVLVSIVPVIIIILITKRGFSSIGIHKTHLLPALRLGLLFSLIPLFFGILSRVLFAGKFIGFGLFMVFFVRIFMMAAAEDVLFVGFLQTRLSGYFKSDKVALCLGAALFSLPLFLNQRQKY